MTGILTWLSHLPLPADADWVLRLWVALTLTGVTAAGVLWFTHLRRRLTPSRILPWPALREWGVPVGFVLAGLLLLCADGVGWLYDMAGLSGARRVNAVVITQGRAAPTPITCQDTALRVHGCQP